MQPSRLARRSRPSRSRRSAHSTSFRARRDVFWANTGAAAPASARCSGPRHSSAPARSPSAPTGGTSISRPRAATRSLSSGVLPRPAGSPSPPGRWLRRSGGRERLRPRDRAGRADSVAVSPDGRNVYATSLATNAVDAFRRNPSTGALVSSRPARDASPPRSRPARGPARSTGPTSWRSARRPQRLCGLVHRQRGRGVRAQQLNRRPLQPEGAAGCLSAAAESGCALAGALGAPEGLAVSPDGSSVYVAAALSNAVDVFARNTSTGALAQARATIRAASSTARSWAAPQASGWGAQMPSR